MSAPSSPAPRVVNAVKEKMRRGEAVVGMMVWSGNVETAVLGAQRGRSGGRGGGNGLQAQALGAGVFPDHAASRGRHRRQGLRPDHQPSLVGGILPLQPRERRRVFPRQRATGASESDHQRLRPREPR